MRTAWNWLLWKIANARWFRWCVTLEFWAQHFAYCPKCGGCGYWECCLPCCGGLFCGHLYTDKDFQDYFKHCLEVGAERSKESI